MSSVLLGVMALVLFASGCASRQFLQDPGTRARSFAPYANHLVGLVDVRTFLLPRVALITSDTALPPPEWRRGTMVLRGNFGCAAAIDSRGYFLTAAHCVDCDKPIYLVRAEPEMPARARRARVVWRGNRRAGEPDLAIVHIPETLTRVFEWAGDVAENDPVMAVGVDRTVNSINGPDWLGGKILESRPPAGNDDNPTLLHDVPIQRGDSGGPLLNEQARLIGINVEGRVGFLRMLLPNARASAGIAERPDRKRIMEIIENDAAALQPAVSEEVFVFGGAASS